MDKLYATQRCNMSHTGRWTNMSTEENNNKIIHEATEGVASTKIKPRKPYVTDAILEVSAHRARLIKTKHR